MIKTSFNAEPNAKLSGFYYIQTYWILIGILHCDRQRAVASTTSRSQVAIRDAVADDYVMSVHQISLLNLEQGNLRGVFQVPSKMHANFKKWFRKRGMDQSHQINSLISDSDDNVFIKYLGVRFPGTASAPRILFLPCIFHCLCRDIARLFPTLISQYTPYVYWRSLWRQISRAFIHPQHHIMTEFEDGLTEFCL